MTPRARHLMQCFLLSEEKWQRLFDFQKGCCAICGVKLQKPNTDHNHLTGEINGILCPRCNRALGRFSDRLDLLIAAVAYLRNPPARQAFGAPHYGLPGRAGTKKQKKLFKKLTAAGKVSTVKPVDTIQIHAPIQTSFGETK